MYYVGSAPSRIAQTPGPFDPIFFYSLAPCLLPLITPMMGIVILLPVLFVKVTIFGCSK